MKQANENQLTFEHSNPSKWLIKVRKVTNVQMRWNKLLKISVSISRIILKSWLDTGHKCITVFWVSPFFGIGNNHQSNATEGSGVWKICTLSNHLILIQDLRNINGCLSDRQDISDFYGSEMDFFDKNIVVLQKFNTLRHEVARAKDGVKMNLII